ncbi:MAG: serine/threonine protein kinase, partial [Firmicutes bacterium]|nr:serine/threonine protein kinase [Bacillota bacterium]
MSSKVLAGRYELLEKIGEGGMSVVYKARCRILKRFVAIKILKPEFIKDNKFTESFRREAQAAAGLTHPNIVNIYDVGREGNIYYIVMELIEGRVLSDIIKEEGPMEYHRVIEITKQIASALGFAHKNNIIHRDVKPHNILITGTGIAKIADFGIAKAVNTSTIVDNSAEGVMGSVHYFSPEQARGGYVDERSDIYSLGIVMYEMLTGRVPFDAENPVSVALMHINDEMVPPSQLAPGIPPGLELIILKATDKYQENRYASAEELIDDLDNIELVTRVVGAPVKKTEEVGEERQIRKQEEELPEKKEKKSKKKLIIAIIIAAAVVAGLIGVGFATGFLGSAKVPDLID